MWPDNYTFYNLNRVKLLSTSIYQRLVILLFCSKHQHCRHRQERDGNAWVNEKGELRLPRVAQERDDGLKGVH